MKNKTILLTGAGGTVGQMLMSDLTKNPFYEIHALERSEQAMAELLNQYGDNKKVKLYLADLLRLESIKEPLDGCEIVIHCAALKHVKIGNTFPTQQAQENLNGFSNILNLARIAGVNKFLFCSTDKAATPTSVMGATKYLLEQICITASTATFNTAAVRFGNILWSSGSLLPLVEKRLAAGQDILLTDKRMTRYLMHQNEVLNLIKFALDTMDGQEIFTYQAHAARVNDILEVAIEQMVETTIRRKPQIITLQKPFQENLHERFIRPEEVEKVRKSGYFLILNGIRGEKPTDREIQYALSSNNNLLSKNELKQFLYAQKKTYSHKKEHYYQSRGN